MSDTKQRADSSFFIVGLFLVCVFILAAVYVLRRPTQINSGQSQAIAAALSDYLVNEGHTSRAAKFQTLVLYLDSPANPGKESTGRLYTRTDILRMLGPPDRVKDSKGELEWIYLYDRFGKRDWFAMVTFTKNDPYAEFGYNAVSTLNLSAYSEYKADEGLEIVHQKR